MNRQRRDLFQCCASWKTPIKKCAHLTSRADGDRMSQSVNRYSAPGVIMPSFRPDLPRARTGKTKAIGTRSWQIRGLGPRRHKESPDPTQEPVDRFYVVLVAQRYCNVTQKIALSPGTAHSALKQAAQTQCSIRFFAFNSSIHFGLATPKKVVVFSNLS